MNPVWIALQIWAGAALHKIFSFRLKAFWVQK